MSDAEAMRDGIVEVRLEPGDGLAVIQTRLTEAGGDRVLVVAPRGCQALRRLYNLKLLARQAQRVEKDLAVLTPDPVIRALAGEAGLSAFHGRALAMRLPWRKPGQVRRRIEKLAQAVPRPPAPHPRRPRRRHPWVALLMVLLLLGLAGVLAVLAAPSATIVLTPATRLVSHTFQVVVDPEAEEADVDDRVVPARRLTVTFVGTAESGVTHQKDVPDAYATGFITMINKRPEPTTISQGAIVSTGTGVAIRFQTEEEVTLPPLGSARVPIRALEPGPSGNVRALAINSIEPRYALMVTVINDAPTSGGTMKRVGVVTYEDKERLHRTLLTRLAQEAAGHLEGKLDPGEFLVPESVSIVVLGETFSDAVDTLTEVLSLQMQVRGSGLAVAINDVGEVAAEVLERQVPQGFELMPESLQFQSRDSSLVQDEGGERYQVEVRVWGEAVARVDREEVVALVRGQPVEEAARVLAENMPLDGTPEVTVEPGWVHDVPWLGSRLPWVGLRYRVITREPSGS